MSSKLSDGTPFESNLGRGFDLTTPAGVAKYRAAMEKRLEYEKTRNPIDLNAHNNKRRPKI